MLKSLLKAILPASAYKFVRVVGNRRNFFSCLSFLFETISGVSFSDKMLFVRRLYVTSLELESPHSHKEMLSFIRTIITLPAKSEGVVVEAGCYKGSSTAMFSLAASLAGRTLVVFDSFEGIPENDEAHDKSIFGGSVGFGKGSYCGALEEVKSNVRKYGKIDCCRFIKGWFDDTMPDFKEPVAAAYIDVDLASSTRTCLKYLYPLLNPGASLYSQDGHLPLVLEVFTDDAFWLKEVGCRKPAVEGLGKEQLIRVIKLS